MTAIVNFTATRLRLLERAQENKFLLVRRTTHDYGDYNSYYARCRYGNTARALPAAEARTVISLWRDGLLTATTEDSDHRRALTVSRRGYETLADWRQRAARHQARTDPHATGETTKTTKTTETTKTVKTTEEPL